MYKNAKAILVQNNASGMLLLENGSAVMVTSDVFFDFNNNADHLEVLKGESWRDHGDSLEEISNLYGEVVAYHDGDTVHVVNRDLWENRRHFFMQ